MDSVTDQFEPIASAYTGIAVTVGVPISPRVSESQGVGSVGAAGERSERLNCSVVIPGGLEGWRAAVQGSGVERAR